jgi:hypothetical protein
MDKGNTMFRVGENLIKAEDYTDEVAKIAEILNSNQDKDFVQRILFPSAYKSIPLPEYGEGVTGTHLMSFDTDKEGAVVYPLIVNDQKAGLKKLGGEEAWRHALDTNQHIRFKDPKEAEWFSKNYKKVWGHK